MIFWASRAGWILDTPQHVKASPLFVSPHDDVSVFHPSSALPVERPQDATSRNLQQSRRGWKRVSLQKPRLNTKGRRASSSPKVCPKFQTRKILNSPLVSECA